MPANISDYAPGDIIRSRPFPGGKPVFFDFPLTLAGTYQLLYRTTGSLNESLATATTVMVPEHADFSKLLSYQVEIDSPWDGCYPSYTFQSGATFSSVSSRYSQLFYLTALDHGWVVSVPDHEGPNGAFAAGITQGRATLDGVRAALRSQHITGLSPDATTTLWGYSGGALATTWAAELQPLYAPDLHIAGAAAGGVAANLLDAIPLLNGHVAAGIIALAVIGISRAHPPLVEFLNQHLLPDKKAEFMQAATECIVPAATRFAFQDLLSYFDIGSAIVNEPMLADILYQEGVMGHTGTPGVPLYIYQGVNDELLPISSVDALVNTYCSNGASVQYVRQDFGEHIVVAALGGADAFRWIMDRMNGQPTQSGCQTSTEVTSLLNASDITIFGEFIFNDLVALLGEPLGPVPF